MGNKKKVGTRSRCYIKKQSLGIKKISVENSTSTLDTGLRTPESTSSNQTPKSSARKFKVKDNITYYDRKYESLEYEIVNLNQLLKVINEVAVCHCCFQNLNFDKQSIVGLATKLRIFCSNCTEMDKTFENCEKVVLNTGEKSEIFYDLNLRLVNGLRSIGKGHTAGQILCGAMNLPPPPTKYSNHETVVGSATEQMCRDSMKKAMEEAVSQADGNTDLCVAVDGSWQKRGHTSLNGVVSVTSVDTGKVLDISVMSKYCQCPLRERNKHADSCGANYLGSSGGMEVAGALEIFRRSEPLYGVRYVNYLGDGDSKAFLSVREAKVYGDNVEIHKLECIGHIQKRMGSWLLKLKASKKKLADGKSISGKNRLTTAAIQKLQTFYGLAIKRNIHSLDAMKQAVWAEYFHVISTNERPTHQLCPKGEDTWCGYNQCLLTNQVYDHNKHFHLPVIIMTAIKPTFKELSNPQLLAKCLKGKTQNPNESLNSVIWTVIPKRVFVTLQTLRYGIFAAVCVFNDGFISKVKIMEHLGLNPGKTLVKAMHRLETIRLRKAEKAVTDLEIKIRKARALKKRKLEDLFEEQEDPDNPSYSAGHY